MNILEGKKSKQSLGRGLSALLGESLSPEVAEIPLNITEMPLHLVKPGKYQPRHHFNDEKLTSLIDSIREKGIIQPLVVRPLHVEEPTKGYEIIAGERRWRAASTIGLTSIPVIIKVCSDHEALETALIENVQRDDLTPIEEAEGYQRLLDEFSYTQEQLAKSIGKSRSHIANMLRLMRLPLHIKQLINEGRLSAGHARALLTAPNMEELVQEILQRGLNVRETEKLVKEPRSSSPGLHIPPSEVDIQTQQLAGQISEILKMRVALKINRSGGVLSIFFNSYEEIDDFIEKIR